MSKHTPGPWKVLNNVQIYDEKLGGEIAVCCRYARYDAVDHANAKLIAAAPDLLSALEECLPCLGWEHDSDDELRWEHEQGNGYAELILRARAAIAKARAK